MTLEEAIKHLNEQIVKNNFNCIECKAEHIELLEWLVELRELRNNI